LVAGVPDTSCLSGDCGAAKANINAVVANGIVTKTSITSTLSRAIEAAFCKQHKRAKSI